ncbi:MAG: branched-chain amino acid ABC transporter permease [Sulfitobacter sp.]|nr:branched-chain amino acid ABC transporter permease [Sulfitobacter sp.]
MTRLAIWGLVALLLLAAPFFVYPVLLMSILCFVIFASSFNLLLGYAGLLCFGQAMFFGTAAYVTGYLLKNAGISIELALIAGALLSAAMGFVVGMISVRRSGIQFAMITLAISQFVYFLLLQSEFTGGEDGMQRIPRSTVLGVIDVSSNLVFYYVVLAITVLAIALFYRIVHSPFGEILKAIRDNEPRVESLGFRPERYKIVAMTLSAGLAGLAGGLKATVFQFATLTDVSWPISAEVILMTLLGGLGTLAGPMIGAGIVLMMNDHLAQFGEWSLISQGVILLVVILFFRRGVVGELNALVRKVQGRRTRTEPLDPRPEPQTEDIESK